MPLNIFPEVNILTKYKKSLLQLDFGFKEKNVHDFNKPLEQTK